MKRRLFSIILFLSAICPALLAEGLVFEGIATDDVAHKTYEKAKIEIYLDESAPLLKLIVLPSVEAMYSDALVDTVWSYRSYYREAPAESSQFFEERRIFYLYSLENDKYLDTYTVFSQFVDKQHKDIKQIVIRKFDEKGQRLWCVNINADAAQTDAFFKLLQTARKKLKFQHLTKVIERPDPNAPRRPDLDDYKVKERNHMHGGSPYGSGW